MLIFLKTLQSASRHRKNTPTVRKSDTVQYIQMHLLKTFIYFTCVRCATTVQNEATQTKMTDIWFTVFTNILFYLYLAAFLLITHNASQAHIYRITHAHWKPKGAKHSSVQQQTSTIAPWQQTHHIQQREREDEMSTARAPVTGCNNGSH